MTTLTRAVVALRNAHAAFNSVLLGLACVCVLTYTSWTWWSTRSWLPAEAIIVSTQAAYVRTGGRDANHAGFSYAYSMHGNKYTGSQTHPDAFSNLFKWGEKSVIHTLQPGLSTTVWVNPRRPQQAVLLRTFGWYVALGSFFGSLLAFSYTWSYFRRKPTLRRGHMIPPEPPYRGQYLLAFAWNLITLQFAVIAVWDGKFWPLLTVFLIFLTGILFAGALLRTHRRRWQLGPPMFVDASEGTSMSTARFVFSPRYGVWMHGRQASPLASLEYRQVMYRTVNDTEKLKTVQVGSMGTQRLDVGSRSFDFTALLPDWPIKPDLEPAYWELALSIGGTCLIYRFARDLRD